MPTSRMRSPAHIITGFVDYCNFLAKGHCLFTRGFINPDIAAQCRLSDSVGKQKQDVAVAQQRIVTNPLKRDVLCTGELRACLRRDQTVMP